MALKSSIFKANLQIADIDNGYYADHALTLARHPSETDERMMVRLVALALHAHALQTVCGGDGTLGFGAGLSDPDEPDVWLRDFTGQTRLWIEVGQPEDKPVAKACGKADAVHVYAFHHAAEVWWRGIEGKLARLRNLSVWRLPAESAQALAGLAERSMQLQATVQEGGLMLGNSKQTVHLEPQRWK
ncbi:MAG TPA: YaeQ family protein [Ramlibacter sp.]|nr:YaeQ family protein [Ramlibacter sp.]